MSDGDERIMAALRRGKAAACLCSHKIMKLGLMCQKRSCKPDWNLKKKGEEKCESIRKDATAAAPLTRFWFPRQRCSSRVKT